MKRTMGAAIIALFCATTTHALSSLPVTAHERKCLIAGIDNLARFTLLQRRSGIKFVEHYRERGDEGYNVTVIMAADGASAEYEFTFGSDPRYPHRLWPKGYTTQVAEGTGADTLRSDSDRRFCLQVIKRLDQCTPHWQHFGKAMIQKDGRRGFRISFLTIPQREINTAFKKGNVLSVMDPYLNISVTRKGTIYGITEGG
jgi:hypothetical protein